MKEMPLMHLVPKGKGVGRSCRRRSGQKVLGAGGGKSSRFGSDMAKSIIA
jgi:hypothetical protein